MTVGRDQVHPLADGADLTAAALVTLGAIAELGVARAADVGGRSLAVVGAGAIGLLAQRIGAADGAKPCTVVAASTAKDTVVAGDPAAGLVPPDSVDRIGADVVVEATGAAAGLDLAVRAAAPGGTVVVLGTTRAEAVPVPLDLVAARALRVVGAHAGLLDAPGGTSGLDRRSAAQRFLDRVATGSVRVDDLVTSRADPASAADLLDRVGADRTQVVPVLEWWRLAPDLRARAGGLDLPNPFRRGLAVPLGPAERSPRSAAGIVEHPPAPARAGAADPVTGGWSSDAPRPWCGRLAPRAAAAAGCACRGRGVWPRRSGRWSRRRTATTASAVTPASRSSSMSTPRPPRRPPGWPPSDPTACCWSRAGSAASTSTSRPRCTGAAPRSPGSRRPGTVRCRMGDVAPSLADIDLLVTDFDGVLTDNRVLVSDDGHESVVCTRADGIGCDLLKAAGLPLLILSTETNRVVAVRGAKLGVEVVQGCADKGSAMRDLLR